MKKRIAAIALAAVMVLGTVAAAAGSYISISVVPGMDLIVDGEKVTPTLTDGSEAQLFSYEGTTYAPVRFLAGLLGMTMEWDESNPTAAILNKSADYTCADTIAWDGEYDVVVVGFGGAGAVTASTAADEGAKVLLVEKAPEGHEGGNTRYCAQLFVYGNEDEEATYTYYKALAGGHEIPEAMLRVYTKNIAHMKDIMEKLTGIDQSGYWNIINHPSMSSYCPEYPELPGSDKITLYALHEGTSDSFNWLTLRSLVTDRAENIDVWFESPATHLIQDPETKTILGVQVERDGKTVNIKATNGVALTCGGFENNPEMVATYLGLTDYGVSGTFYNTGDGIRMAQEVGADLWHMEVYEGSGLMGATGAVLPAEEHADMITAALLQKGASVLVSGAGKRFLDEGESGRHGHMPYGDVWLNVNRPARSFFVCAESLYDAMFATGYMPKTATVYRADSVAELAEMIDVDAEALTTTIENFNSYAEAGYDPEFGRDPATMAPFSGRVVAIPAHANILNTQGGPRRNENAEVIGLDGDPIPHLYSAGEIGGICAYQYQGGGNIAECVIFGQLAGKNAAAKKDALPAYEARTAVDSELVYTPGAVSDIGGGVDVELANGEYLGVGHGGMGGDVYVKVTMADGKIAKVEVVEHKETEGIGTKAVDALPDRIVEAQSTEVDGVATATMTSNAIKAAVEDALSQVNK